MNSLERSWGGGEGCGAWRKRGRGRKGIWREGRGNKERRDEGKERMRSSSERDLFPPLLLVSLFFLKLQASYLKKLTSKSL